MLEPLAPCLNRPNGRSWSTWRETTVIPAASSTPSPRISRRSNRWDPRTRSISSSRLTTPPEPPATGTGCGKERTWPSDRIERFNGDLNTGSTKTLVDFVQWAHHLFPAERYALVLWGHGSGHDDQNVYRADPWIGKPRTAARLAQRRLGFFSGTRRSILEQGPTRGYGYDDTAGDFLDNGELRKALLQVKEILGRKLDLLGFDACLMAMIEVAYQIHDLGQYARGERTDRTRRRLVVQPRIPRSACQSGNARRQTRQGHRPRLP